MSGLNFDYSGRLFIRNNMYGITLSGSDYNDIKQNVIENSYYYGIDINGDCANNVIYHNYFLANNGATTEYDENHIQAQDGSNNNNWYDTVCFEGNCWSDWQNQPDEDMNGIVDDPYILDGENEDPYPLVVPLLP